MLPVKRGLHFIDKTVRIPSGTHLKAEEGCRIVGGRTVKAEACPDGVWVIDLKKEGITPAPLVSRGYGRSISPSHNEVFVDGRPLVLSRYPKNGNFLTMSGFPDPQGNGDQTWGRMEEGFFYSDDRPKSWRRQSGLGVFGYWAYDWAPTHEAVDIFDAGRCFVKNLAPYGVYRYNIGQRFCFTNVIDEMTEPGEYSIDYDASVIRFIPPEGTDPLKSEIIVSVTDHPLIDISDAEDVRLEGFSIGFCRGTAVTIKNSRNVTVTGCEMTGIGNRAMNIDGSNGVTISRCHIHDTGDGGVQIWSGDRASLERAEITVENCHLHDISKWDTCYEPPIRLYGVGLTARCNKIHDCPHSAVLFGGNYISIVDNEIYRCVMETGDAGAIYGGRDYTFRGNEVSRNFIHHIGTRVGYGTMAIYNDDCLSGTVMRDNVIFKVQRGCFLGGGRDFVVDGNIFIDCHPAIELDGRGASEIPQWHRAVSGVLKDNFYKIPGGATGADPLYLTRWPELKDIDDYYKSTPEPFIVPSAYMGHNRFCDIPEDERICYTWATENGEYVEEYNRVVSREELKTLLRPEIYEAVMNDMQNE